MPAPSDTQLLSFTSYQKFVVAALAFLQFTIILDFMIMSPLGAMLMPALDITPSQFGVVVSVYAFSAGAAGFLAAGFADKFDRKKILIFFYCGFIGGTLLCGIANSYYFLLFARIVTGLFGGVIGSIVFAITTDLFPLSMRGRVMGFLQTAFAASQILGIPVGLYLSNQWGWRAPFFMIVGVSLTVGILIFAKLKPIDAHLRLNQDQNAFRHLLKTVSTPRYQFAFMATALLSLGGFMLMPFGSAYTVNNLGVNIKDLPLVYLISGIASMFIGPIIGRATDRFGKLSVFAFGTFFGILMVLIYTNLGITPLPLVILVNSLLFLGIFSRMIPSQAMMSAIPDPSSRGAFMSIGSSIQQVAGGFASIIAGLIIVQRADGVLEHFNILGYILVGTSLISLVMIYKISKSIVPYRKT
ncbi:MAG: MFS transporter [Bdellovibrionales bacterium]|nr:MFS transporter [Bdellovibrionales bacterium]